MNKKKVIIDCDPGIDDLLALSFAMLSEEIEVIGISTVFGNVPLEYTSRNAALIADSLGKEIKIIKGLSKPLFYERKRSSTVHGEDGLGYLYDKYRSKFESKSDIKDGIYHLRDLILSQDEKVTIIAMGPLTNIAALLMAEPDIKNKIEAIYIMGGGLNLGNSTELSEFNFFSDSYAAKKVMNSKIKKYLSSLDVTSKVYFTKEELDSLNTKNDSMKFIKESIEFYSELDPYMHDVVAVLSLTHPDLFTFKEQDVDVITGGDIEDGQSYGVSTKEDSTFVVDTEEREKIIKLIFENLETLS